MADRLDVFLVHEGYVVAWEDEGYAGGWLGLSGVDDDEHVRVSKAAADACPPDRRTPEGFVWDELASATKALRAARAEQRAIRDEANNRPWPDWAKTAVANGFKPPRKWHP